MGRKLSQVMWFECFMNLTHKNYVIYMYRWKCWWKCCGILKYQKWRALKLFDRPKCEFEVKTVKEQEVGDTFPGL
jgi:hypothetical protein